MDRFVWFVLLVVMTHLVTEFTRVTGYARGTRHEVVLVNDTLLQAMPVQNLLLYPGHEQTLYDRPASSYMSNNVGLQPNGAYILGGIAPGMGAGVGAGASASAAVSNSANNEQGYAFFSFRPIIDSIFEIPISTLRAVNSLVARLTGSYRQATADITQKSASLTAAAADAALSASELRLPVRQSRSLRAAVVTATATSTAKKSLMRKQLA